MTLLLFCFCPPVPGEESSQAENSNKPGSGQNSFYRRVLSGKYNLLEDDFKEVRPKTTRYDYINETTEDLRLFSRPDDEFAILNLQLKDGGIYLNDFSTVMGRHKTRRGRLPAEDGRFFYRLISDRNRPVLEETFEIPVNLFFDFLDESTGTLSGGAVMQDEVDFVLKIPLRDKSADKIIFYERPASVRLKSRAAPDGAAEFGSRKETIIGETLF